MMNPVKGELCFPDGKKSNTQHKPSPGANIQIDVGDEGYEIVDPALLVSHQRGLDQVYDFIRRGQSAFLASMMNSI
jgi:hypothetical protein